MDLLPVELWYEIYKKSTHRTKLNILQLNKDFNELISNGDRNCLDAIKCVHFMNVPYFEAQKVDCRRRNCWGIKSMNDICKMPITCFCGQTHNSRKSSKHNKTKCYDMCSKKDVLIYFRESGKNDTRRYYVKRY